MYTTVRGMLILLFLFRLVYLVYLGLDFILDKNKI
jgi:hypothetical protein